MINSNVRKLSLSGWLMANHKREYDTPLKLQKFLLFYESFSKISGEEPDFGHLRGYKRGPVFSDVWGDYTKEKESFAKAASESYASGEYPVNEDRAKKSAFIVGTLSESELSELTHQMNLWKSKEKRIMAGEYQVSLEEKDFGEEDVRIITALDQMYPIHMINDSVVYDIDSCYFVVSKEDAKKLSEEHFDILSSLVEKETLHNPVYVSIDKEGRLLID